MKFHLAAMQIPTTSMWQTDDAGGVSTSVLKEKGGLKPFYDRNISQSEKRFWWLTLDWSGKTLRAFDQKEKTTQRTYKKPSVKEV